jgi:glycosyltransferase involved in cell wall biosynthesis
LRRADRIFLLSRQALDLIPPGILGDRAEVIPMGVPPPAESRNGSGPQPAEPYFLIATDLLRYKGIEVALRAMALLPSDAAASLVVCGRPMEPSYVRALRSEAQRLGVASRVRWLGSVGHAEILRLMHEAVGCIIPSRFENQSRVPVEAMSQGSPVVASDVPAFREACGDAALYFALDEPSTLAAHAERLLRDPDLRDERVRAGRNRVGSLSPLSASERILESLERLT